MKGNGHLHSPSQCGSRFLRFWDYLLWMGRRYDWKTETAHCGICGERLLAPVGIEQIDHCFSRVLIPVSALVGALSQPILDQLIDTGTDMRLGMLIGFLLTWLLYWFGKRVSYAWAFSAGPWCEIDIRCNEEEQFWEQIRQKCEQKELRRSKDTLAVLGTFWIFHGLLVVLGF